MMIELKGRIDSENAAQTEAEIQHALEAGAGGNDGEGGAGAGEVVFDASELTYISSAGLRVLLHIRKQHPDLRIENVCPEVYEILDMTGFTQMMHVGKAYRKVSIEGCEEIGRGANGTIYRIDRDNVVKVYNDANALEDIQHEREVARLALILGIPTAISYDVVRVGDSYGSVFELLNASSFSKILAEEPEKMDWCVREYVELLNKIHGTVVPEGKLPDMKELFLGWMEILRGHVPDDAVDKLRSLVQAIPHDDHMIHGDYHTKNVMLQGDEVLLIDMDTLSVGHPVFELAFMYNAFIGHSELDRGTILRFQGYDFDTAVRFWHKTLAAYLGTEDEAVIKSIEDKARVIGYARLIRHVIRFGELETETGRAEVGKWTGELLELLGRTDTLVFDRIESKAAGVPDELTVEAAEEKLPEVLAFVDSRLEAVTCSPKNKMQIGIAAEEVFVNIAKYAYAPDKGDAVIRVEVSDEPPEVTITFTDRGKPYDPLAMEEPDITLPAEEREIGGLGIFMVRKIMDDVTYEYKEGMNILKMSKKL